MFKTSTFTSNNCAVVACLLSSSHLPLVVAIDNAPFNFKPLEKSNSLSNFLYSSKEYKKTRLKYFCQDQVEWENKHLKEELNVISANN